MLSLPYIVQHLTYVYDLCINHSCFPSDLKTAKVVPLPKAKDLTDINNYSPISVLSSLSKPLEKHVHKHLLKYLDRFNIIHTHQSGFRPKHSCQSALTCLVERLLSSINDSKLNGVVFLDLKKAFDFIDHQMLLKKDENVLVKRQCHSFLFCFCFFYHTLAKENKTYLLLDIIHLRALLKLEFHRGLFLDLFSSVFI